MPRKDLVSLSLRTSLVFLILSHKGLSFPGLQALLFLQDVPTWNTPDLVVIASNFQGKPIRSHQLL